MRRAILSVLVLLAHASASSAQAVVAELPFDGRTVVLFNDGSWRYKADDSAKHSDIEDCRAVSEKVEVCVPATDWGPVPMPFQVFGEEAGFEHDKTSFGYVAAWATGPVSKIMTPQEKARLVLAGKRPRLELEDLVETIKLHEKQSSGSLPLVSERFDTSLSGRPAKTVVFLGRRVQAVTFLADPDLTVVVSTEHRSTLYTDDYRKLHDVLVGAIKISD